MPAPSSASIGLDQGRRGDAFRRRSTMIASYLPGSPNSSWAVASFTATREDPGRPSTSPSVAVPTSVSSCGPSPVSTVNVSPSGPALARRRWRLSSDGLVGPRGAWPVARSKGLMASSTQLAPDRHAEAVGGCHRAVGLDELGEALDRAGGERRRRRRSRRRRASGGDALPHVARRRCRWRTVCWTTTSTSSLRWRTGRRRSCPWCRSAPWCRP